VTERDTEERTVGGLVGKTVGKAAQQANRLEREAHEAELRASSLDPTVQA
jgi:hypothetical protein